MKGSSMVALRFSVAFGPEEAILEYDTHGILLWRERSMEFIGLFDSPVATDSSVMRVLQAHFHMIANRTFPNWSRSSPSTQTM